MFALLFTQLLQKLRWKSALLIKTIEPIASTRTTTSAKPQPMSTAGSAELFRAGAWAPIGRQAVPSQY
jgi:hypothetical protein